MATLQFKDDCDSMKVGLRELDSSWTRQANELREIGTVTVSCSQVPQVLSWGVLPQGFRRLTPYHSQMDWRYLRRALRRRRPWFVEKSDIPHCVRGEGALQQDVAHFRGRNARVHRPYIFQKVKKEKGGVKKSQENKSSSSKDNLSKPTGKKLGLQIDPD
ncbi:hypothetical protein GIB67_006543 [Kingdonia uniflora]|uniref:Uncharacterized protein n=1 Tax=Kingdonia uniflora TaxID=39325 RepID=A0A7J7LEV7_9MAGN|nr:hypothetical protein GIB67_006543 [Kingdonia uniflora]